MVNKPRQLRPDAKDQKHRMSEEKSSFRMVAVMRQSVRCISIVQGLSHQQKKRTDIRRDGRSSIVACADSPQAAAKLAIFQQWLLHLLRVNRRVE